MASRLTTLIVVSIVAGTFIAGIMTGAQRDDDGPVDLIVYNGKVYTGQGHDFAEAVAVRGNTIVRVGSNREIKRLRRPQTTYIDAHGGAVVPGFNDAHVHFVEGSLQLAESAADEAAAAPTDREHRLAALRAGIHTANALGITSVHNAGTTPDEIELWNDLRDANELTLRTYHALSAPVSVTEPDLESLEATRRRFGDDPMFKTGSIEIVPEETTPARRPDQQKRTTQERLNRVVTRLDMRGWQVWIRAEDENALHAALDALEAAVRANPVPDRGRRHRIEYSGSLTPEEAHRMTSLGIVVSLPVLDDGSDTASWSAIASVGGNLALGSDWPAVPLDPRVRLRRIVERAADTAAGGPSDPAGSLLVAIDAYTIGGAYASFDEQRKGALAGGMLADIVVLSADIFEMPPERLPDVHVEKTIVDGEVVYSRAD